MLSRRLRYFRFHFRGRGGTWLALLGQVIAVVGLPLPAAGAKDQSRPFPCQHRACGCLSAGDCWTSCCCFTAAQRIAWAEQHDAEPPQSLFEQARQETSGHDCCDDDNCPECPDTQPKPCCTQHSQPPAKLEATGAKAPGWLLVIQARRCLGAAA